jgi:hypothetical protein
MPECRDIRDLEDLDYFESHHSDTALWKPMHDPDISPRSAISTRRQDEGSSVKGGSRQIIKLL